jgi:hypothetical protein
MVLIESVFQFFFAAEYFSYNNKDYTVITNGSFPPNLLKALIKEPRKIYGDDILDKVEIEALYVSNRHSAWQIKIAKRLGVQNQMVLLEDGLGNYSPRNFLLGKRFKPTIEEFINLVKWRFNYRVNVIPIRILNKEGLVFQCREFQRNILVKSQFGDHLASKYNKKQELPSNSALVLSQWLTAHGLIPETVYCEFLTKQIRNLQTQYGKVYLKFHPRDTKSLKDSLATIEGVTILPEKFELIPAEFLALELNSDLYGFWSTAIIYSPYLFNIKAYSFIRSLLFYSPLCDLVIVKEKLQWMSNFKKVEIL